MTGAIGAIGPSIPVSAGSSNGPIGVFDSGVGGLTVLRALRSALPTEEFIYLGDTARLPYGTKSPESVVRYSLQCAEALINRGIRALVVACNTASASALGALRSRYPDIPVFGVIEPGAAAAVSATRSNHIAVIGTEGTIGGQAYQMAIHRLNADVRVTARACSLFVAMAEEGWIDGLIAEAVARRYLQPIFSEPRAVPDRAPGVPDEVSCGGPDTLVLGCTHFPVLSAAIRAVLPEHVRMVDSAATIAAAVARELAPQTVRLALPAERRGGGVTWLATDGAARFARVSSTFLGEALHSDEIEIIDL
ncbi:MAG TPA: glutamate racemase [Steroidobacteraceae bacterium]|nr:glutamate racemase [Steroidobacteraceae bacterium]